MILVTAATEFEMNAFLDIERVSQYPFLHLVVGVGPVQTAQNVTRFLVENKGDITGVINFGVGGAFFQDAMERPAPELLDICVADREVFGDFGVCKGDTVEYLPEDLTGSLGFDLNNRLLGQAMDCLNQTDVPYYRGTFVTVNSVSGHRRRGDFLQKKWNGLCENMEGAAIAQACSLFSLDLFELRCISNMVEDRNPSSWKLQEACEKAAFSIAIILEELQ